MPYMLSLSHLCKLRPQTSFQEILLVLSFVPRNDTAYHSNVKRKKPRRQAMLLASKNIFIEGLHATKESLPVKEETTVNTDPKISPQIQ